MVKKKKRAQKAKETPLLPPMVNFIIVFGKSGRHVCGATALASVFFGGLSARHLNVAAVCDQETLDKLDYWFTRGKRVRTLFELGTATYTGRMRIEAFRLTGHRGGRRDFTASLLPVGLLKKELI